MKEFTTRNLRLFFRDKMAVFFSLLSVFIVLGLYVLFLGDVWASSYADIPNVKGLMNSWIMAGIISVTSVTTTMGAFGVMIDDKRLGVIKDFYTSPAKRSTLTAGYIFSAFLIGVIMSVVTLVIAELYLLTQGVPLLSFSKLLMALGVILVCTLSNSALVLFLVSLFTSSQAFATASTIIGTLIGFLTGIYLPVGSLPEVVQTVIKVFPPSHGGVLLRQIFMEAPSAVSFAGIPAQYMAEFDEMMGVVFKFGGKPFPVWGSIAVMLVSTLVFFGLAVLMMSRKKNK